MCKEWWTLLSLYLESFAVERIDRATIDLELFPGIVGIVSPSIDVETPCRV